LKAFFDVEALRREVAGLGEEMSKPGYWGDQEEAKRVSSRFSRMQGRIQLLEGLREGLSDSEELLELAGEDEQAKAGPTARPEIDDPFGGPGAADPFADPLAGL
jgi:hypothetical protein